MTIQTIKLAGKRFVIIPEKAYRALERRAKRAAARPDTRKTSRLSARLDSAGLETLEDEADVRAARSPLREKGAIPWEQVKAELGLGGLSRRSHAPRTSHRATA